METAVQETTEEPKAETRALASFIAKEVDGPLVQVIRNEDKEDKEFPWQTMDGKTTYKEKDLEWLMPFKPISHRQGLAFSEGETLEVRGVTFKIHEVGSSRMVLKPTEIEAWLARRTEAKQV